jgi:hypothetical protein
MGQLVKNRANDLYGDGFTGGYTYSAEIADGESDVVKIPPSGRGVSVGIAVLVCGTNTGRVDVTIDSEEAIDDDSAVWISWETGETTGTVLDTFQLKVTAIRAVSVSGPITFKLSI